MSEPIEPVEEMARTNQEWPASLKAAVQEKVGKRGLTEFTVMAVQRQLEDGSADLAVEARDARDLAQRLANVLATVVDQEARLTFLANVELPEWIDTRSWPDEVLERINAEVVNDVNDTPSEPEPEIDPTPELAKVGEVTMTRLEERADDYGTETEPVLMEEQRLNNMDATRYSLYRHVHTPEGRCLKNVFITADAEGRKHCPLTLLIPQEKIEELGSGPESPVVHRGDSNLFERLKQSGALKPASEIPKPPAGEPAPPHEPPPSVGESDAQAVSGDAPSPAGLPVQTAGPDSGPLPDVPASSYPPDAVPLEPASASTCPECGDALDGGLCWNCGYES